MSDPNRPTRGMPLGRLFGARVVLQPSTLLMLVILAFVFGTGGGMELTRQTFTFGLVLAVLLFVSVFIHELAHAVAARAFRRRVNEIVITLWGGHTSFDAQGMSPLVSGVTAAAGPLANLGIALGLQGFLTLGLVDGQVALVLTWLVFANIILAIFNALPGIPMDGGRVLEAIVWQATGHQYTGTKVAAWGGRIVALGVLVVALGVPLLGGNPPTVFAVVWSALIFMILWPAATAALKIGRIMSKREGLTVRRLMVPAEPIRHTVTVEEARQAAQAAQAGELVVMSADGVPAGHFPVALTEAVPAAERDTTSVQSVTMPVPRGAEVNIDIAGDSVIEALQEWWGRTDVWVVMEDGEVRGIVKLAEALKAAQ